MGEFIFMILGGLALMYVLPTLSPGIWILIIIGCYILESNKKASKSKK